MDSQNVELLFLTFFFIVIDDYIRCLQYLSERLSIVPIIQGQEGCTFHFLTFSVILAVIYFIV